MVPNHPFEQLKAFYQFLLPTLSEEGWALMEQTLSVRHFKKGEFIHRAGSVCNNISFINSGYVRMYYTSGEREKIVCFFNENNYVADYHSFITQKPAALCIQALSDVTVTETCYNDLQRLYREMPEGNHIGRLVAEFYLIKMKEDKEIDFKTTIGQRYEMLVHEQPWVMQHVPQYMVASYLGISPEALSRIKAKMNKTRKASRQTV